MFIFIYIIYHIYDIYIFINYCYFTCSLPLTCNMNQSPVLNLFWKNLKEVDFRENFRHRQSIVLAVAVPDLWETTRQQAAKLLRHRCTTTMTMACRPCASHSIGKHKSINVHTHTYTLKLKPFNFSRSPCMCAGNAVLFFLELHSFSTLWNCALWARKANCTAQCGVCIFLWQCDILGAGMTLLSMLSPIILIISWQKQPLTLNMKLSCAISPCHVVLQCFGWDACSRSSGTKWHKSLLGPQEKSGIHPHLLIKWTDVLGRMSKVNDFCLTSSGWLVQKLTQG